MEQIRRTIKIASPVTGERILAAIEEIAKEGVMLKIQRKTILEDGKQAYIIGFERKPADNVLWLVIGHGPVADRNLFLDRSYSSIFIRTEKNLEYKPSDEIYEQRFGIAFEAIMVTLAELALKLERCFLPEN